MVKLGDVFKITSGGTPEKNKIEYYINGTIPWIKTGDLKGRYVSKEVECITEIGLENSSAKLFPEGTVLLAMYGATIGACSILGYEGSTNQACAAFLPNKKVLPEYLYYYLSSKKENFIKDGVGGAQPNISAGYLKNVDFNLLSMNEQEEIVSCLDKVENVIGKRKQQLQKLDELVKARFVEMFGDVTVNSKELLCKSMVDICEIIDGDRGKNYPKQEDFFSQEYCLFLNTKNVTVNGFDFGECRFVTREKDESLRKGKLRRGDIVLTTRGTIGNLAFYDEKVPYDNVRINSGMVILRMNRTMIVEIFFIEQFKMLLQEIKREIASGSAQPQLPISTMKNIKLVVPELKLQEDFSAFVQQINKSKLHVQKSLEKLEILKKALMQKYFG